MSSALAVLPRASARVLSARVALGAIVLAGTGLLTALTRQVVTPSVFPDEYLYSQLGRSLATTGHLRVRGVDAHFLPVLQPLLTAPLWLVHDVGTAFRLIQIENAFVMSLAALPAYWIARRLGVSTGLSLAVAALTVSGPPLLFSGMVMAESFAYPLTLTVVAAAVYALERPSLRAQVVLLALSGVAAFDRLQLGALPICAAAAVMLMGLRERRLRAALREQALLVGAVCAGFAAAAAYIAIRGLGYYHLAPRPVAPPHALALAGLSGYVVLLAAGMAVAPSGLVGLANAIGRPRGRAELAFGFLTVLVTGAFVLQCVLWGDVHRVQERYLGYLVPLLVIAFAVRSSRVERRWVAEIGVAAGVAAVAAIVPLSGYAIDSKRNLAPTLYAFARLQNSVNSPAETAALFALGATALAVAGALCAASRRTAGVAIALSGVASLTLLVLGLSWSGMLSKDGRSNYLPADARWVDHADGGAATMLVVGNAWNGQALATLFWNPSVARVVRMPGANKVDWLDDPFVRVAHDGAVTVAGRPVRGNILVDTSPETAVTMRDARQVHTFAAATLWHSDGVARLGSIINNRLSDGRVLRSGGIEVWSGSATMNGWVELRVRAPHALGSARMRLVHESFAVPAGTTRVVRVAACGRAPWTGGFVASPVTVEGNRWRSPVVSVPRYVPDPRACS